MNKTEMIMLIAKSGGITKKVASKIMDDLEVAIITEIKAEKKVTFGSLFTMVKTTSKERKGVNPATLEKITIKASNRIKFKALKKVKELLNQ